MSSVKRTDGRSRHVLRLGLPSLLLLALLALLLVPAAFAAPKASSAPRPVGLRVALSDTTPGMGQVVVGTAQLYDQFSRPVRLPGVLVRWSRYGAGGIASLGQTYTGWTGTAQVAFTAPAQYGGTFNVVATAPRWDINGRSAQLTIGAGPAVRFTVTQSGGDVPISTATVGTPLLVRVTARDAGGHTATDFAGTVTLTGNFFPGSVSAVIGFPRVSAGAGRAMMPDLGFVDRVSITPGTVTNMGILKALCGGITTMPASSGMITVTPAAPLLVSLSPSSGSTAGGTVVTITGTDLMRATAVTFGGVPATFDLIGNVGIRAVSPAGQGTVQVVVTSPSGTSNGLPFTYTSPVQAPVLYSVSPIQGPAAGGNTVTLYGRNLSRVTAVTFGAGAATNVVFASGDDSYGSVTATAPSGSGPVQVTATTPGGTSNGVPYTYFAAPALISAVPGQGPAAGGSTVVLTGTDLVGATAVSFGATPASSFTVESATRITAVCPAGTGTVQVTVTTVGGTSNGVSYTYVPAPVLLSCSPASGPPSGGTVVTLTGTGLLTATSVSFGMVPASAFVVVSDTQITAVTPASPIGTVDVSVMTANGSATALGAYMFVPD